MGSEAAQDRAHGAQVGGDVPPELQAALGVQDGLAAIGVGDIRLVPKIRLLREDQHGISLAIIPTVTLPTAGGIRFNESGPQYQYGGDYLGEGPGLFAFIPELAVSTNIGGFRPAVNLAYRLRQPVRLFNDFEIQPEIVYRAGLGYDVAHAVKSLSSLLIFAEIFGATADRNPFGLVDQNADPDQVRLQNPLEALIGARYRLPIGMSIEGGIGTGLRAGYGSPDLRAFLGVRYSVEDQDADDDGINDDADKCKDDPEDKDGFEDKDGCPDSDNDADGIPDASDACPNEAEDFDGFNDADGCPEDDADQDGIPDAQDACPKEPGGKSPDPKKNGCPSFIKVEGNVVRIMQQVHFATGSTTILPESFPMLQEITNLLKANKGIKRMSIEGHTDNRGPAQMNKTLSAGRAQSVMNWLIQHGVENTRLESHGYGLEKPIEPNDTDAGRAANRRVEFKILDEEDSNKVHKN